MGNELGEHFTRKTKEPETPCSTACVSHYADKSLIRSFLMTVVTDPEEIWGTHFTKVTWTHHGGTTSLRHPRILCCCSWRQQPGARVPAAALTARTRHTSCCCRELGLAHSSTQLQPQAKKDACRAEDELLGRLYQQLGV